MNFPTDLTPNGLRHLPDFGQVGGVCRNIALALLSRSGTSKHEQRCHQKYMVVGAEIASAILHTMSKVLRKQHRLAP